MLEIKNLHVAVDGKEILKGLSLRVDAGEVHARAAALSEELGRPVAGLMPVDQGCSGPIRPAGKGRNLVMSRTRRIPCVL